MRSFRRALLAAGFGFALPCVIAACGGGAGLLSADQANSLNSQLNQISADITAGHCRAAEIAARNLQNQVAALPSTVESRLRQDLDLGAVTVGSLATTQCHQVSVPATSTPTSSTTTPTTPTTPTTATTNTTPTNTTTQTTTTSATTTTTTGTNTGPSGGGGLGNNSGNGSGNGSGGGSGHGSGGGSGNGSGGGGQQSGNSSGSG